MNRTVANYLGAAGLVALLSLVTACPNTAYCPAEPRLPSSPSFCGQVQAQLDSYNASRQLITNANVVLTSQGGNPYPVPPPVQLPSICQPGLPSVTLDPPRAVRPGTARVTTLTEAEVISAIRRVDRPAPGVSACGAGESGVVMVLEESGDMVHFCSAGVDVRRTCATAYAAGLVQLETYLNSLGRSLKDPQQHYDFDIAPKAWDDGLGLVDLKPEGEVLWGVDRSTPAPAPSTGAAIRDEQRNETNWPIGDDTVGGNIFISANGTRDADGYEATSRFAIDYTLFGSHGTFVEAKAAAFNSLENRNKSATVTLNDKTEANAGDPAVAKISTTSELFPDKGVTVRAMIGPVPVMLQAGVRGTLPAGLRAMSDSNQVDATESAGADVRVYLEGFVGWDFLALGVGADLVLFGIGGEITSHGSLDYQGADTCYAWEGGYNLNVNALAGSLYVTVSVFVPWEGQIRKYRWSIGEWEGIKSKILEQKYPSTARKCITTCDDGKGLMCGGKCLVRDNENCETCGDRCSDGKTCSSGKCSDCRAGVEGELLPNQPGGQEARIYFGCDGPIPHLACTELSEPSDPQWQNNYVCIGDKNSIEPGRVLPRDQRWQSGGPLTDRQHSCSKIESSRPGWEDNYFCRKTSCTPAGNDDGSCMKDVREFQWLTAEPRNRDGCVQVDEPNIPGYRPWICFR